MQEYWFCSRCKSMNRAAASKCYSCRAPRESFTLATKVERPTGAVLTPGLDEEHRAVAWTLMERQIYVSAWRLGYLSAALLIVAMPIDIFLTTLGVGLTIEQARDPSFVMFADPRLLYLVIGGLGFGLFTIIVHSVFLGLATMDAPALGSGSPRFSALRAGVWWIESYLWVIRAGLAFVMPPLLTLFGIVLLGSITGIVLGVVWMACAYLLLGDPIRSLAMPRRLLQDLYDRSGVPGSPDSRVVSLWALSWGAAQGITYAASCIIYFLVVALVLARYAGLQFDLTSAGSAQSEMAAGSIALLIGLLRAIADGIALLLLAATTVEISRRQRYREQWVLSGPRSPAFAGGPPPVEPAGATYPWTGGPGPGGPLGQ